MADPNYVTKKELNDAHEKLVSEFKNEFKEWREKAEVYRREDGTLPPDIKEQFDALNDRLDTLETKHKRKLKAYERQDERETMSEEERKAKDIYETVLRRDKDVLTDEQKQRVQKTLVTDDNTEGGYIVPTQTANSIIEKLFAMSPVREFADVVTLSQGDSLKMPREGDNEFGFGWTGERSGRPETDTSDFEMLEIPTHEMYAKPLASQQMLDDSAFDIESWIERKVTEKFARTEGTTFVNGDGSNKPLGILQADAPEIASGDNSALTYQGLLDLVYDIEITEYLQNATLMMNRKTLGDIRAISDNDNMPIWQPGLSETDPPNILGYEYFTATDMPTVSSGAKAIVFGDLSVAYQIVDRQDIRFLRDPYSSKPFIEFYYTKRVGAQVKQDDALRFQTITS